MRKLIVASLLLITSFSFCQSLIETIDWIGMNSRGREFVRYNKSKNKLQFVSVRTIPNVDTSTSVQEFNPKDVVHISVVYKKSDWNSILITFKNEGSIVRSFFEDEETKEQSNAETRKTRGIELYLNVDKQMIDKYKKAYINLFQKLGVTVKDGNFF